MAKPGEQVTLSLLLNWMFFELRPKETLIRPPSSIVSTIVLNVLYPTGRSEKAEIDIEK